MCINPFKPRLHVVRQLFDNYLIQVPQRNASRLSGAHCLADLRPKVCQV